MSFINSYDEIKAQIEERIDNIDGLSATDAALVAASAQLLNGRNQPISNMPILLEYLQDKQDLVADTTTIKEIVLLLGASMGSKNVVWRTREFLANGTFTVPNNIAGGVVYITGCGGGGSGASSGYNSGNGGLTTGGAGGFYVEKYPVPVSAADSIPAIIGVGGLPAVNTGAGTDLGNDGGDSVFGSLVIKGGEGGINSGTSNSGRVCPKGGFITSHYSVNPSVSSVLVSSGDYVHGSFSGFGSPGDAARTIASSRIAAPTGGGAGYFGSGGNAAVSSNNDVTASSALPNTGAGGGAAATIYPTSTPTKTVTSGAGGSGRIIVEWQEFV